MLSARSPTSEKGVNDDTHPCHEFICGNEGRAAGETATVTAGLEASAFLMASFRARLGTNTFCIFLKDS